MQKYKRFENDGETGSAPTDHANQREDDPPPSYTPNPYSYPADGQTMAHPGYTNGESGVQMAPIQTQPGADPVPAEESGAGEPEPVTENNMDAYIIFSVIVCICCSPLFGCIATFVACGAKTATRSFARKSGIASIVINITGIVVSVIIVTIMYLTGFLRQHF